MAGNIVVGTASWSDPGFLECWYPPDLPARKRLEWYAQRLDGVEVNSTFYAVPAERSVERWAKETPERFTFDVKLHRLLSRHAAPLSSLPVDLRDRAETTARGRVRLTPALEAELAERQLEAMAPLARAGKLSSFLVQLTPAFAPGEHEISELADLVDRLAPFPVAIELRHRAWVSPKTVERTLGEIADLGAVWVGVDAPQGRHIAMMPPIDAVTRDDLAYLRAHGRNTEGFVRGRTVAERFGWVYEDDELQEIAGRARDLAAQAETVHVMFNNNRADDAPRAALRMRELLGQSGAPVTRAAA
ncbi:MAG: hypothetical protein JWN32_3629 [Solirubrobacterales bacterium]|nr:hypothetical protein [Solirubrobacterales bacterium]